MATVHLATQDDMHAQALCGQANPALSGTMAAITCMRCLKLRAEIEEGKERTSAGEKVFSCSPPRDPESKMVFVDCSPPQDLPVQMIIMDRGDWETAPRQSVLPQSRQGR
jgi:hypothetical protein